MFQFSSWCIWYDGRRINRYGGIYLIAHWTFPILSKLISPPVTSARVQLSSPGLGPASRQIVKSLFGVKMAVVSLLTRRQAADSNLASKLCWDGHVSRVQRWHVKYTSGNTALSLRPHSHLGKVEDKWNLWTLHLSDALKIWDPGHLEDLEELQNY